MGTREILALGMLWGCTGDSGGPTPTAPDVSASLDGLPAAPYVTVWRGFEHAWTHNHRWNRFGSWAAPSSDCTTPPCWTVKHASASGTSADEAQVTTFLSMFEQGDLGFAQTRGVARMELALGVPGWRQTQVSQIALDSLPAAQAEALRDRELTALLNGFDVVAVEGSSAAKPISFHVSVDEVRYVEASDAIDVQWTSYLRMDCTSEECSLSKESVYEVHAELAVLASDTSLVRGRHDVHRRYGWDAPRNPLGSGKNPFAREIQPQPQTDDVTVTRTGGTIVPAFTALSMHLFRWDDSSKAPDQHMVAWHGTVRVDGQEDEAVSVTTDLMFKNWVPDMRKIQVFAYEEVGAADMRASVALLEVPGEVVSPRWSITHAWQGNEAPASGDDAVSELDLSQGGAP